MYLNYSNSKNSLDDLILAVVDPLLSSEKKTKTQKFSFTEKEGEGRLFLDVPGYEKKEISLFIKESYIEVKCENKSRGLIAEKIALPKMADKNTTSASLKNGVLEISIKKHKDHFPTEIKIT